MSRWLTLCGSLLVSNSVWGADIPLDRVKLPSGFAIDVYSDAVPNARSLELSPSGVLFVGTSRSGKVYAVVDRNRDNKADHVYTIAEGLYMPNGVAFRNGALYVAEVNQILRFDDVESRLDDPPQPVVVYDKLPSERHHGWKFIDFGPEGKLYLPVGAPCNVCDRGDPFASVLRMDPDGTDVEVYARGVRNSVGLSWHPETGELWFTDNGRDSMGDDRPPCELNHAPRPGMHFGFPYVHGNDILDPLFGSGHSAAEFTPPAQTLGPHVAPLGLEFYTGSMFPAKYKNQIFIAEHGSWNRSEKIGYRVVVVRLDSGSATSYEPFAEGWLKGQRNWGRPVDMEIMSDGSLLLSDDEVGAVYRIRYSEN